MINGIVTVMFTLLLAASISVVACFVLVIAIIQFDSVSFSSMASLMQNMSFGSYSDWTVIAIIISALLSWALNHWAENKRVKVVANFTLSSLGYALLTLTGVAWGAIVSVSSSELKNGIIGGASIGVSTFVFVVSLGVFVVATVLHHGAKRRKNREEQSRPPVEVVALANKKTIELAKQWKDVAETSDLFKEALSVDDEFANDEDLVKIEKDLHDAKQRCMKSMIEVLEAWNGFHKLSMLYRCNLFMIIKANEALETFKGDQTAPHIDQYSFELEAIKSSPFFLFNNNWEAKLERAEYILINEQSLSQTISNNKDAERSHQPICMPYSASEICSSSKEANQPNMHGAPLAMHRKGPVYHPELTHAATSRLKELSDSPLYSREMTPKFKDDIMSYYNTNSTGSLISIPIFGFKGDTLEPDSSKIRCILNVYANKNDILANSKMAEVYADITAPFCHYLSKLTEIKMWLSEYKIERSKTLKQGEGDYE